VCTDSCNNACANKGLSSIMQRQQLGCEAIWRSPRTSSSSSSSSSCVARTVQECDEEFYRNSIVLKEETITLFGSKVSVFLWKCLVIIRGCKCCRVRGAVCCTEHRKA
jgi:hypothetical protein